MKKCPKCNTIFLDDSQICKRCSEPLIEIETKNERASSQAGKIRSARFIIYLWIYALHSIYLFYCLAHHKLIPILLKNCQVVKPLGLLYLPSP